MHPIFLQYTDCLDASLQRLLSMEPVSPVKFTCKVPTAGVYLFSEQDQHLYVGRSNSLRRRMVHHGSEGATHNQASFAFRLARISTGNIKATYKAEGSRASLMTDPVFKEAFVDAKNRIRGMQLRFIEEIHPLRQTLLEVYVAVVLKTSHNNFDNH